MKVFIIGGNGMAGHILVQYFDQCTNYSVHYTTRIRSDRNGLFLDVRNTMKLGNIIEAVAPNVIINCVGLLNENARNNELDAYRINSIFPHDLKVIADKYQCKVIHISTDCVFAGKRGNYTEQDEPDGTSVYAKTKALGEIADAPHLTIRTSIIGPEVRLEGIGLMQWFRQQRGIVKGYENVLWNGVTTLELAKAIHFIIEHSFDGLLHLGNSQKISKLELLRLIQHIFHCDSVKIEVESSMYMDRTIMNTRKDFVYNLPSYEEMLQELHDWMRLQ